MNGYTLNPCRCETPDDCYGDRHVPKLERHGFQRWQVVCECKASGPEETCATFAVEVWNKNNQPQQKGGSND